MKNQLALLVPILIVALVAYALFTALGGSGEQVALISNHALPRGLALMLGAIISPAAYL